MYIHSMKYRSFKKKWCKERKKSRQVFLSNTTTTIRLVLSIRLMMAAYSGGEVFRVRTLPQNLIENFALSPLFFAVYVFFFKFWAQLYNDVFFSARSLFRTERICSYLYTRYFKTLVIGPRRYFCWCLNWLGTRLETEKNTNISFRRRRNVFDCAALILRCGTVKNKV